MDERLDQDEAGRTAREVDPLRIPDPLAEPEPSPAPSGTEDDLPLGFDPQAASPAAQEAPGAAEPRPRYVRQRPPHHTQSAIDDLEQDRGVSTGYAHDSNVAVRGGAFSGGGQYRRSHGGMDQIQRGRYGQYLEVPKGRRSIFSSREKARRRRSLAAMAAVVAVLVVVAIIIWRLVAGL